MAVTRRQPGRSEGRLLHWKHLPLRPWNATTAYPQASQVWGAVTWLRCLPNAVFVGLKHVDPPVTRRSPEQVLRAQAPLHHQELGVRTPRGSGGVCTHSRWFDGGPFGSDHRRMTDGRFFENEPQPQPSNRPICSRFRLRPKGRVVRPSDSSTGGDTLPLCATGR